MIKLTDDEICSACAPTKYKDGKPTEFGKWHGEFPRIFLPMGAFFTNKKGNLEHKESGSENFIQYELKEQQ